MANDLKNYLRELDFNKNEASTYLALAKLGEAKASQIAKLAELPRTTVISILNKLVEENYVTIHVYKGLTFYWVESPQVLVDVLNNKVKIAEKLKEILPNVYHVNGRFPITRFFDTKKGIKNFIEKTLNSLTKGVIIYTIDTPHEGNYGKIFSDDLENVIFNIKKTRGVTTRTLIPAGSFLEISKNKLSRQDIVIKELPVGLKFKGSLWLIKDMLINFSGNPPFLVATKQNDIVDGMKGLYDFLWQASTPKKAL